MTFSRAVGQLLQARRGMPAQMRKAVWNLHSRPTEDSRSAQIFVETSRTSLLGRFYLALEQTESYTYPCNIIAELRTTTTHEEVRSLAAIGTQHQGTFTAIHYRAPHVAHFLSLTQAQAISPGPRTKTLSPTCVDPTRGTASPTHTHMH